MIRTAFSLQRIGWLSTLNKTVACKPFDLMPEYEQVPVFGERQIQNRALAKELQRVPFAQRYYTDTG